MTKNEKVQFVIKELENLYPKTPSKWNCKFCPYGDDKELCGAGAHFS